MTIAPRFAMTIPPFFAMTLLPLISSLEKKRRQSGYRRFVVKDCRAAIVHGAANLPL
jgi:hypothetical protein